MAFLYLVVVWLLAAWMPALRNFRFMAFLAIASGLFLAAGVLPGSRGDPIRLLVIVLILPAALLAERIGLGSLTASERALDERIQRAARLAHDSNGLTAAINELDLILKPTPRASRSGWQTAMRLLRRGWSRTARAQLPGVIAAVPARAYEAAGSRFWADMRSRRTIGHRRQ